MKRLLLISNYGWTVFNFRKGLINALKEEGLDVFVQTQADGYEKRLDLASDRIHPLNIDRKGINPLRDGLTVLSILATIKTVAPEVCLLFTIKPIVYGGLACRMTGTPYICNITGLGTAFLSQPWLRRVAVALYRSGLARATHVFFQNKADLELFLTERIVAPGRPASLLPGSGVDVTRFKLMPYPRNEDLRFLFVGRMLRDKGVREFAEAARAVKAQYPNTRFQLLGPVDVVNRSAIARSDIEEWVADGRVQYLGESDDVRPHIAAADCVVLPSYREGAPRAILEAAAIGRPVITTDAAGCVDTVDNGSTGLVCRVRDAQDLAAKMMTMVRLSTEERAQMGLNGRRKVEDGFSERKVIDRYLDVLRPWIAT